MIFPDALGARLRDLRDPVTLMHNHPRRSGLSADDLSQLAKPGVTGIVAIRNDGSVYAAAPGAHYDWRDVQGAVYARVSRTVSKLLRGCGVRHDVAGDHIHHLVSQALARAGVLDYDAALGEERWASYDRRGTCSIWESVLETAARSLMREPAARRR